MIRRTSQDGSIPIAMLLTMVVMSASAAAVPLVLSQVTSTRITVRGGDALRAAQDGLEAAVAVVRSAVRDGSVVKLPCGPVTEPDPAPANAKVGAAYSVSLTYYTADPVAAPATSIGNCALVRNGSIKPQFVRLVSTGTPRTSTGGEARRTLRGDYEIRFAAPPTTPPATATSTPTISLAPTPSAAWGPQYDDFVNPRPLLAYTTTKGEKKCLDPGAQRPAPGAFVTLQNCTVDDVQDNSFQQNWYYRSDLTLSTVAGILSAPAMCIDAGLVPVAGAKVTMQPCASLVPARQRWYYNAFGNYELAQVSLLDPTKFQLSGMCLNVQNPGVIGSPIVLGNGGNCRSATFNNRQTFSTYTKIGPGESGGRTIDCTQAAGYPCLATQIVNNGMPSRCVDRYTTFMANMECVQDPDPANVRWTQLWRLPQWADGTAGVLGPIVAIDPAGNKPQCLTTASIWPTLVACDPKKPTAAQNWRVFRRTGNDYTQFRIVDSNGKCLTHPNGTSSMASSAQFYWNQASYHWKLVVDTCVNSNTSNTADLFNQASVLRRQKWNAPMLLSDKTPVGPTPTATPTATPTVTAAPTVTPAPASATATPLDGASLPLRNVVEIKPPPV